MLNILTVLKRGGDFKPSHLKPMKIALEKNMKIPYQLVCLTDIDFEMEGIQTVPLPSPTWRKWWSKINLFHPSILSNFAPFVFLDLDTAVVGDLSPFYGLKSFGMLSDFYYPEKAASGVMFVPKIKKVMKQLVTVFEEMEERGNQIIKEFRGDQDFLNSLDLDPVRLQEEFPKAIYTFKPNRGREFLQAVPSTASLICFHGKPRPWDAPIFWVARYWAGKDYSLRTSIELGEQQAETTFSILVPSWNRPDRVLALQESIEKTTDGNVELLVGINQDDPSFKVYRHIPNVRLYDFPPGYSICQIWNDLASVSYGDYLMMGNDDMLFISQDWPSIFLSKVVKYPDNLFVAFFDDGITDSKSKNPPNFPIVSRKWVEVVGVFVEESFSFSYCDTWIYDLGKRIKRLLPVREVLCEHLHYTSGKSAADGTTFKNRISQEAKLARTIDRNIYQQGVPKREHQAHQLITAISKHKIEHK